MNTYISIYSLTIYSLMNYLQQGRIKLNLLIR